MRVILKQTIDIYDSRYGVGLKDIPDGYACGDAWDSYVARGWVTFVDDPKPVVVAEVEAEVVADAELPSGDSADVTEPEAEVVEDKPARKKK